MRRFLIFLIVFVIPFIGSVPALASAQSDEPVVRAVLFYSPTCPHCHQVITQDLPRIFAQHGGQPQVRSLDERNGMQGLVAHLVWNDRFELLLVDVSRGFGGELYRSSIARFAIPEDRLGVPQLVFAERVLVGSFEIPRDLPGLIEQGLAAGGADWPPIPGLTDVVALVLPEAAPLAEVPTDAEVDAAEAYLDSLASTDPPGLIERLGGDPVGNGLAIAVLLGMLLSLGVVVRMALARLEGGVPGPVIPILLLLGIAIAGYLTFVEAQGATAVCGPVGDCNAVQDSQYATLLGVMPVGLVGLIGYLLMLGAWATAKFGDRPAADVATASLLLFAVTGTVFSAYLTFLEPFVIGAVCLWCLSSAALITALMLLSARAGVAAIRRIGRRVWV